MTKETVLKKAIEKASKKGFDFVGWLNETGLANKFPMPLVSTEEVFERIFAGYAHIMDYQMLIFNHSFAKSFFGKKIRKKVWDEECGDYYIQEEWEYRLQQMVLEKEPLNYIKKFLE